jgi:signal transduction histidine kinase
VAATIGVSRWVGEREREETRRDAEAEARHVAAQLSVALSQAFAPLTAVATWWQVQGKPLAPEDWKTDAQLFLTARLGLERLIWVENGGRVAWSARPGAAPDSRAAGPDDGLAATCSTARETDSIAMSPVFGDAEKPLAYVCLPVYREGRRTGFIAGEYNPSLLLRSVAEGQLPDGYAISVLANGRRIFTTGPSRSGSALESRADARVADMSWTVGLAAAGDQVFTLERTVSGFGIVISGLLYVSAAMARLARRRAKEVASLNRDLQRKLAEFETLLDVLPVGIAVAEDPECRRIWTNRSLATMLNIPYGQNASHSPPGGEAPPAYRMLRKGIDVPPEELPMQIAARTAAPVDNCYLDIVRSDGAVVHTLSYAAPLFDEHGRVRGVIDACVDITPRVQLENRLQQAEKYQSLALMAGGIAHDFNNLLTVIIGNANSAAAQLPEASGPRLAIKDVEEAAGRAAELVAKLLAFTGRFWRETTPIDLSDEVARLLPRIREMVPSRIAIRSDLAPALPKVEAGSSAVQQILIALASNAVEALEGVETGEIVIRTMRLDIMEDEAGDAYADQGLTPGPHVCLEVSDTGSGIAEGILARVFDPFFTTKFVGRGLGLSAVHGIVRAHHGAVRLTSATNQGTRVEVIFPALSV